MSEGPPLRFCGRDFSPREMELIRDLARRRERLPTRAALARAVCRQLDWRKPDGGLKFMSASVALLRMHRAGLLELPPPRGRRVLPKPIRPSPATDPPAGLPPWTSLADLQPLRIAPLQPNDPRSRLWNEYIARYHYLGYKQLPGAQLRYFAHSADGFPLALLGFGAAAWKTKPRDDFIGWDSPTRQRHLPLLVNNARFLILPWAHLPNLASHLLGHLARRLPRDWRQRYCLRPVLLETFCQSNRFHGTCYRAANWIHVGHTQGRGKLDSRNLYNLPVKDIFLKPIHPRWRSILNS